MSLPWPEKYRPKTTSEIVGQTSSVTEVKNWIANFKTAKEKALLLTGPVGSGKTSLVKAIANELEFDLIEMNASDVRKKDQIESLLGSATTQQSLLAVKGKLVLVDEVDGISGNSDRGGMAALGRIISKTSFPIILTATDKWNRKLSNLRKKCIAVNLKKVDIRSMAKRLEEIVKEEHLKVGEGVLTEISRRSEGDLRAAINDLESLACGNKITMSDLEKLGARENIKSIFDTLFAIYKTKDPEFIMDSFWKCDKSPGEIMLWLIETIPKEYEKPDEIAEAFDNISRADIFNGRIPHSQAWSLMSYSAELTALGTAMAKQEKYKKFTKYMPPTYLMRMGRTRMSRAMRKKVSGSIGEKLHCSRKVVGEHYGYYRMMAKKYNKAVGSGQEVVGNNWLGLEEDELVFLKK